MAALVLITVSAFAFVILRRRTDDANALLTTRMDASPADATPWTGSLNDPLLEAMASSARQRGRPGAIPPAAGTPTPIAAWVKRLDAEMNVLADLADVPAAPRTRARGRAPRSGDDKSLSA